MSKAKRGLGKGLSALIQDKEKAELIIGDSKDGEKIELIELAAIKPKQDQPRKKFDKAALSDLTESIKANGVIQPIILRKVTDGYEIIAGERRYRAAKAALLTSIPSIVRKLDDETSDRIALIENVQRENLNPIEEAQAYKKIMNEYGIKQEELGKAIGKSRVYISNNMRLLNLDPQVIAYIYEGKLTSGHGKALLGIRDKKEQLIAAEKIISLGLNVRATEEVAKSHKKKVTKRVLFKNKESFIVDLEDRLMQKFGTKVTLAMGKKTGKIEIEYYNREDLNRIIELLIEE